MSTGNISQWGEVKKKTKDRSRAKPQDSATVTTDTAVPSTRGGRARGGSDGHRGGRGRATDRGRGLGRGGHGGSVPNGARNHKVDKGATGVAQETPVNPNADAPAESSSVPVEGDWDKATEEAAPDASWEIVTPPDPTALEPPAKEAQRPSTKPDGTRSWASIFNKPTPAPASAPAPAHAPAAAKQQPAQAAPAKYEPPKIQEQGLPPPISVAEPIVETPPSVQSFENEVTITPSKDELTETNLEQVLDTSAPPPTATAASTVGTALDQRSAAGNSTPLHGLQPTASGRPPMGGFATSAFKATGTPGRSASFQRKVLEQQEAVVMPSNHAVDRAAVQFGSMGLNGNGDDLDVDDDREEPETRTQPPQHSPVAPRATLPPARQQQATEPLQTPRQAPGLPPVAPQTIGQPPAQSSAAEQIAPTQPASQGYPYNQFNSRYGPQITQPESSAPTQKAYEPFGQQASQSQSLQQQYGEYPGQTQASTPATSQAQQPSAGAFSSAANDYSSYYTSDNQRNAYQNYYANYAQQAPQAQPDSTSQQQKNGTPFQSTGADHASQYASSSGQAPQQSHGRFGQTNDSQTSGQSTPNPAVSNQQGPAQGHQSHQMPQSQGQGHAGAHQGGYPYGHPYYNTPYNYSAYMNQVSHHSYGRERPMFDDVRRQYDDQYLTHNNQFGYGGNQGGYGSGHFGGASGKQGMYGQPHQGYGITPQTSYDHHSSSPANAGAGAYGHQQQLPGRESAASGGGLGGYGRSGSTQPADSQQHGNSSQGQGGMPDVFARSQSGYVGQAQGLGHHQAGQHGSNDESMRSYGDASKVSGVPSPAPGQQAAGGRPGSAVQGQTGLPTAQSQGQQGYAGYPGHMNPQQMQGGQQGSQYGSGIGGLGGHQQQSGGQSSGYGGYGGGFGGSGYYGSNNRGGWGGNYGQ